MTFTRTADLGGSATSTSMGELGQLVMASCDGAAYVAVGVTRRGYRTRRVGMTAMVEHNDTNGLSCIVGS